MAQPLLRAARRSRVRLLPTVSSFRPNGPNKSTSQGQRPWSTRPAKDRRLKGRPFGDSLAAAVNGRAVGPLAIGWPGFPGRWPGLGKRVALRAGRGRRGGLAMVPRSTSVGVARTRIVVDRTGVDRPVLSHPLRNRHATHRSQPSHPSAPYGQPPQQP